MRKLVYITVFAVFFMNAAVVEASVPKKEKKVRQEAVNNKKGATTLSEAEIQKLSSRVDEINTMDIKSLTPKEKREVKKELRDIKDKLDTKVDGIYIGGGALLVIIIILLLL